MQLDHGRTSLSLVELQTGSGPSLLLLHELYGSAADWRQREIAWTGAVYALDFSGHGASASVKGGAYFCELLTADADCALAQCDATVVAGAGLGAYVALLLSGARADQVQASLLLPGRGLVGGGELPRWLEKPRRVEDEIRPHGQADPLVSYFESDIRPVDYAATFAAAARALIVLEDGTERPPWWKAARTATNSTVVDGSVAQAFTELSRRAS